MVENHAIGAVDLAIERPRTSWRAMPCFVTKNHEAWFAFFGILLRALWGAAPRVRAVVHGAARHLAKMHSVRYLFGALTLMMTEPTEPGTRGPV